MLWLLVSCSAQMDTVYYSKKGEVCAPGEAAHFTCTTRQGDHFLVTNYYLTGVKKAEYTCSSLHPKVEEGVCTFWYKDGKLECQGMLSNNMRTGIWTWYNKRGKISSQLRYKADGDYETLLPLRDRPDTLFDSRYILKLAPLSLIDPYSGPSLRMGLEFKLKGNIAGYVECGGYFPQVSSNYAVAANNGLINKVELKYYTNKEGMCGGDYFSIELFNKYQSYTANDSFLTTKPVYAKSYQVYKDVTCLTFKYGYTKQWRKHFVFDSFVGLGIRHHTSSNTLTTYENDHIESIGDYGLNVSENRAGSYWFPNIDFGVKVGYRFK